MSVTIFNISLVSRFKVNLDTIILKNNKIFWKQSARILWKSVTLKHCCQSVFDKHKQLSLNMNTVNYEQAIGVVQVRRARQKKFFHLDPLKIVT